MVNRFAFHEKMQTIILKIRFFPNSFLPFDLNNISILRHLLTGQPLLLVNVFVQLCTGNGAATLALYSAVSRLSTISFAASLLWGSLRKTSERVWAVRLTCGMSVTVRSLFCVALALAWVAFRNYNIILLAPGHLLRAAHCGQLCSALKESQQARTMY